MRPRGERHIGLRPLQNGWRFYDLDTSEGPTLHSWYPGAESLNNVAEADDAVDLAKEIVESEDPSAGDLLAVLGRRFRGGRGAVGGGCGRTGGGQRAPPREVRDVTCLNCLEDVVEPVKCQRFRRRRVRRVMRAGRRRNGA